MDSYSSQKELESDSREKLEADVHDFCERFLRFDAGNGCEFDLLSMLDRQAAIIERELKAEIAKRDKGIERLKARRDELAAERDALANELAECMDERNRLKTILEETQKCMRNGNR